jgi:hypothetical protein
MELSEVILWICFLSGAVSAAILSRSNRAGTGCLLGLLGPIGLFIAFRMRSAALEDEVTPNNPQCGVKVLLYQPASRKVNFLSSVILFILAACAGSAAYHFNHTWVVLVAGPLFLAFTLVGIGSLKEAALPYPLVGVFENGLLIDRVLFRWNYLRVPAWSGSSPCLMSSKYSP